MNLFIKILVIGLAAGITVACHPPVQLGEAVAAIAVMIAVAIIVNLNSRRKLSHVRYRRLKRPQLLRSICAGLVIGAAGLGALKTSRLSREWHPALCAIWTDRDRNSLESKLNHLEADTQWEDAATTIQERLQRPASPSWRQTLITRQVHDTINAAIQTDDLLRNLQTLEAELTRELHDTNLVDLLIQGLLERERFDAANLAWQNERLSIDRAWSDQIFQAHLDAAEQVERYPVRSRRWLDSAGLIADRHAVDDGRLMDLLSRWQIPTELPAAVTVEVLGVTRQGLITKIDLTINLPNGDPFKGLKVRDFCISRGGKPVDAFTVELTTVVSEKLQLAVVIDCSSSTQGAAIRQAIAGGIRLVESIDGMGDHRLWKFGTQVTAVTNWSRNPAVTIEQLSQLKAEGTTALLRGMFDAQADLATRNGRRVMVMFSDGRNTVNGPPVDRLIAESRDHGVTIYVVALQTADVDLPLLQKVSASTGGQLFVANDVERLIPTFERLADSLRHPTYRLTVLADELTDEPIDVQVGGKPGRRITVPVPAH